jgi:mono/diheme cytochrome c family protein
MIVHRRWQWAALGGLLALLVVIGYFGAGDRQPRPVAAVKLPTLTDEARAGREAFDRLCAGCHGANAAGSPAGPPLVHAIYRPAHHADVAFTLAVQRGVPKHHWRFGDMPPMPQARGDDIRVIVQYVRELQRANGID